MFSTLPPDLEEFVESEVSAGEFASREDAIVAGVRLLQERRQSHEPSDEWTRRKLQEANEFPGENIVLETPEDFRAFAESIKVRGRERLAQQRGPSWLRSEIARSDDDIAAGRVRRFETIDELRAFGEEINARGMARLERKAAQP